MTWDEIRAEAFGQIGLLPNQFYDLEFGEYVLLRKGYIEKVKVESQLLRFQTALICEAFIGKGQGARFVIDSWQLEEKPELTSEQIREMLKRKKERDALTQIKKQNVGTNKHTSRGTGQ